MMITSLYDYIPLEKKTEVLFSRKYLRKKEDFVSMGTRKRLDTQPSHVWTDAVVCSQSVIERHVIY